MANKEKKFAKNDKKKKGDFKKGHEKTEYQRERDAVRKKRKIR